MINLAISKVFENQRTFPYQTRLYQIRNPQDITSQSGTFKVQTVFIAARSGKILAGSYSRFLMISIGHDTKSLPA
jgi:hypothetical protein